MRFLPTVAFAALLTSPAIAQIPPVPNYAPDDIVYLDLSTEGFVTTKTAKVQVAVNAAANDEKASSLRADMQKAVNDLASGTEWRLTSFNRSQDQSGLTRWDAMYEARISEKDLGGMNDRAKKASKPGMALSVVNIDFTPTLAEGEARKAELRQELYKRAQEELSRLNGSLPNRSYRISDITFAAPGQIMPEPRPMMKGRATAAPMMAEASFASDSGAGAEVAQQLRLTARVTYAARPPAGAAPAAPPASVPTAVKAP